MKCHRQKFNYLILEVILFIANCLAENLIFNVNFKKPMAVTSSAFLSFTLDPTMLINNADILTENIEKSTNMARGLAPAYVRLGGPQSNSYIFKQTHDDTDSSNVFFESHWTLINQWAKDAGLDLIACIAPRYIETNSKIHPDAINLARLFSFSDHMNFNVSWQLGYECQTRCDLSGEELGRYVVNLRQMLKTFPKYSNSLITGPDIVAYKTAQQQEYLRDYLNSAGAVLSAITWHPDFASITVNNDNIDVHYDDMGIKKDEMYEAIGHMAGKKPLWIAESKPEESKHQYLGALIWIRRLGNAAKLGIQVVMRQLSNLNKATPDYWTSLLHKTLVGREVLETKIQSSNESHVHFYSQCTKASALYKKGAITIFGVNLTPRNVTASLKGFKIKTLHKYILSPDSEIGNKMFSEKVLLNNEPLNLINNKELPDLSPEIITDHNSLELKLSSGEIGFWVIPDVKIKACIYHEEEITENIVMKKLSEDYENAIRRINREEKEKKSINQSNFVYQKTHVRHEKKKLKTIEGEKFESQQKFRNQFFMKLMKLLREKIQWREKSDPSYLQKSSTILTRKKGNSSKEADKLQDLDNKYSENVKEIDDKITNEDIRDILRKYKHILLQKKIRAEVEDVKSEMQNINNSIALISKIDALLQLEEKIASNVAQDMTRKEQEEILNRRLKEDLDKFDSSAISRTDITEKIEKYFGILYNLLVNDELVKNNQSSIYKNSMKGRRFRRDLTKKKLEDLKKNISRKRLKLNDLKDQIKQKRKQKTDDKKVSLDNLKNFDDKRNNLLQQRLFKKFYKDDILVAHQINQLLTHEHGRTKRHANRKLTETDLRKDNIPRKRSKIDDVRDHINERKIKRKDDLRKERLSNPFNLKTTDSDENNFYGFYWQDPINGFPEGDVFITVGDSVERNDYDYVDDDEDDVKAKKAQQVLKTTTNAEDNTWVEVDGNYHDYMPNEFFENVKFSNARIKENSKDYSDLSEAEFFFRTHKIDEENNNNGMIDADVIRKQPHDEEQEKQARQRSMQKLVNYYDNSEEEENKQDLKYELEFDSRSSIMPAQLTKTSVTKHDYANARISNTKSKIVRSTKTEPESKISTSFQSFQKTPEGYNYRTSSIGPDEFKLDEEKNFDANKPNNKDDNNMNKDDDNMNMARFSRFAVIKIPTRNKFYHDRRTKRNDWKNLRKVLAEEMIKENEDYTRDCHCRIIRTSNLPKERCDCRIKRESQIPTNGFTDSSLENKNANTEITINSTQSEGNVKNFTTKEEYDKIMTGDVLLYTGIVKTDIDRNEFAVTTETVELDKVDHRSNDVTQTTNTTSTSAILNSEINNSEYYHNTEKSTSEALFTDLSPRNNESNIQQSTENIQFFRTQPPDVRSGTSGGIENKETTWNSVKTATEVPPNSSQNQEELLAFTNGTQETTPFYEKAQNTEKEEKIQHDSICASTKNGKDKEQKCDENYKVNLNLKNISEVTTEKIVKKQAVTDMIFSKRVVDKAANSKSNESKTTKKLQNTENGQNARGKPTIRTNIKEDNGLKKAKNISQDSSKAIFKELARNEEYLTRRAMQIEKLKEKLYAKRENLMRQYKNLINADEQKRNLKRRETWETFCEKDTLRQLIDQGKLIRVLINNDATYKIDASNEKEYVDKSFSTKLVPRYNPYYQFLRGLNMEVEREPLTDSKCPYHKMCAIDPSTYRGGEPILQTYEDSLEVPKYLSKLKQQTTSPIWTLKDFYRTILRPVEIYKSQIYNNQENMKKLSTKNLDDQGNVIALILNKHKRYDRPREFVKLSAVTSNIFDKRNINQAASKINDNVSDKTTGLTKMIEEKVLDTETHLGNEKFANIYAVGEDVSNIKIAEDDKNTEKDNTMKSKLANDTEIIDELHKRNDKIEDNLNITMSNNNSKEVRNIEGVVINNDDPEVNKRKKEDGRTRRYTEKQNIVKYLKQLPLSKTDARNDTNRGKCLCLEENSEETLSKQPLPLLELKRLSSDAILLQKQKDHMISSNKDFKINQSDKNKLSKYIIFMPTKDVSSYEILGIEDFERPLERSKFFSNKVDQYLITKYLNNESSEEPEYIDLLDMLNKNSDYTSNEEMYSSDENDENKEVSKDIEDNEMGHGLTEDEQYELKSEEFDKYLEMMDKVQSDDSTFMLLPWEKFKIKRQRRQIENKNKVELKTFRSILAEDEQNESDEYYLNTNNINKDITKTNYLQSRKDRRNDDLLEDFIEAQKNDITFMKNKQNDKSLKNNVSKNDKNLPSFIKKTLPQLQNVIIDSMEKAQNLTKSVEQFVDNIEENFNKTLMDKDKQLKDKISGNTTNAFHAAITNIKKFFTFFSGISRILHT